MLLFSLVLPLCSLAALLACLLTRILRHIEENPPGWTITERRLTKIMKKHSLTTRTDAPAVLVPEAPAARAGGSTAGARRPRRVARQRGLAFSQAREQFALQLEVERFFVDRSFSQADAEQLSWMVLQEDETSWLETLVANPHYLNDGRLERVLRDSIAAMEFTNMALAQQLYSALRVFEAILRDGPVSYVVA